MMTSGRINPAGMITHIGGLNAAAETTLNLPKIPGGKKLIYTHIDMPLTAIDDFAKAGETDPRLPSWPSICGANNGLWSGEAEEYLLAHANRFKPPFGKHKQKPCARMGFFCFVPVSSRRSAGLSSIISR